MNIFVINCGSSSVKYQLLDMQIDQALVEGILENIGTVNCQLTHTVYTRPPEVGSCLKAENVTTKHTAANHGEALDIIHDYFLNSNNNSGDYSIAAVGHRVVHGGEQFSGPAFIDDSVLSELRDLCKLAPLHNPANISGIEVCMKLFPEIPHIAVFDTAFHQTMPAYAYRYPLPKQWYEEHKVRRYGFHGTSHANVAKQAAKHLQIEWQELNLISLHLGNGASAAAIHQGSCVDTSMGLTPLEGLMMGSRCGDIDPDIPNYMQQVTGQSAENVSMQLNKQSGLKGVCGDSDMRVVERRAQSGDTDAQLALDMFCYRLVKYVGAYFAVLGKVHALIFTAGIGENSKQIRARVCQHLTGLGIDMDMKKNQTETGEVFEIQTEISSSKILVINTNEELEIAQQVYAMLA